MAARSGTGGTGVKQFTWNPERGGGYTWSVDVDISGEEVPDVFVGDEIVVNCRGMMAIVKVKNVEVFFDFESDRASLHCVMHTFL